MSRAARVAAAVLLIALILVLAWLRAGHIPPTMTPAFVESRCGVCHRLPPPEALPAARWPQVVADMAALDDPRAQAIAPAALALGRYYAERAPAELKLTTPGRQGGAWRCETRALSPPGLEPGRPDGGIPAVAQVRFLALVAGKRPDLLIAEMRSSALFVASPWAEGRRDEVRLLARDLNYPVHVAPCDLDGDGLQDLIVAGIGGMNPGNETRASLTWLQRAGRGFAQRELARAQPRLSDARAADLDGDGDQDIVACGFGWRGPGELILLENQGGAGFAKRVLDDRDGAIHVEIADLDGDGRRPDLLVLYAQEHELVVCYLNRGGLRFEPLLVHQAPHPAWGYSGLQLIDFDGDGDLDALVANGDALDDHLLKPYHGVSWLENTGLGGPWREHRIADLPGAARARAADLDGDGDLDVVTGAFLPQLGPEVWRSRGLESLIWLEQAPGGWLRHVIETERPTITSVDVADADGDGRMDIAAGRWVWLEADGQTRAPSEWVTLFLAR